jgi:hypothetical protein
MSLLALVRFLGGWRATSFAAAMALCAAWAGFASITSKHYLNQLHKERAERLREEIAADARSDLLAAQLEEALRQSPKAGVTIREVVKRVPSDCPVPAAASVRDAIRASNAARGIAEAVRGDAEPRG